MGTALSHVAHEIGREKGLAELIRRGLVGRVGNLVRAAKAAAFASNALRVVVSILPPPAIKSPTMSFLIAFSIAPLSLVPANRSN